MSDEISRKCTTECPKSKGVIDLGQPKGRLACYIGYSSDKAKNDAVEVKGYNHIRRKYCKNAKTFTKHFCREDMPFGVTADVSWNTGTITCNKTCTNQQGIVSKYKKIKISDESFTFSICYTSFICPNEDAQVLYAMNRSDGRRPDYRHNDCDDEDDDNNNDDCYDYDCNDYDDDDCSADKCDDNYDKKYNSNERYCIGKCNTKMGFIAEVPMGSSTTFLCITDYICPLTAPYVYEFIEAKIGKARYRHKDKGSYFDNRFATPEGPMMRTLDYYEEFEEDYNAITMEVHINAIGGRNNLATKCAKTCTRLDGILYVTNDLSSADDISHDNKELGPLRNYERGFCYNSTKRCLNSEDYRRIRSDGLHSTITCVNKCNRHDGYILKIKELISAYFETEGIRREVTEILNKRRRERREETSEEIDEHTIKTEFFPNEPSDICLYGNLVT